MIIEFRLELHSSALCLFLLFLRFFYDGVILILTFYFHSTQQARAFSIQHICMSRYDSKYQDPVIDKETLEAGLDPQDPRMSRPIKSMTTSVNLSPLFYDEDLA